MLPNSTHSYGESQYWDERYSKEGQHVVFDWYQRYDALRPFFDHYLHKDSRVLVSGCGNSALTEDMAADGYQDIWNIDISKVLINALIQKNSQNEKLKYQVMDARQLQFEPDSFDAIVDKGTLDSIMCGSSSVENAKRLLSEAARVLKPGGIYMLITYGDPRSRMSNLQEENLPWKVQLHILPRPGADVALCEGHPFEDNMEFLLQPVVCEGNKLLPSGISMDSGDVHYVYVCTKNS